MVPYTGGSGLKIKLIDALSRGKATVTTTSGILGVEMLREHVTVRDDATSFSEAVTRLLTDEPARRHAEMDAITAIAQHFVPERAFAQLDQVIGSRIAGETYGR